MNIQRHELTLLLDRFVEDISRDVKKQGKFDERSIRNGVIPDFVNHMFRPKFEDDY